MNATARLIVVVLAGLLAFGGAATIAQAQRTPKGAPVPFEVELSKSRRDRSYMSFNEHIAAIPANRIRDVPVVNGRMGDRVTVTEGHTMYFPLGYLVTATFQFDKQRSRTGSPYVNSTADLEPNPAYAMVQRFDTELGPVCARTQDKASDVKAEFRMRPDGRTMAVVLDMPGRYDALTREKSRSYAVFVGAEERYVAVDQTARRLLAHCRSNAGTLDIPHDGSPLNIAQLSGTGG
ncbi:MAG: hypothetical protein AB7F36_11090 [Reyranellaceae bacterium]